MKLFYALGLFFIANTAFAQSGSSSLKTNADDNTLLWEISGNGLTAPSYLFGTFHLLCREDIHFSEAVKQAIGKTAEVYLELDLDDPSTLMGAMMLMHMKDGIKLKDLYTSGEYLRIANYFKDSLKTPITLFERLKPEFLIALLYPKMIACQSAASVEEALMQIAKENAKAVNGLETMAYQASLFDSIPYEKQADALLNNIDSMEKSRTYFNRMLAAYNNQRLDEIEKIINTPEFDTNENMEVLLDNRNRNWVIQLRQIMKKNPVFTAVGAGHLAGKNGLIALLKADGYVVRGLENK